MSRGKYIVIEGNDGTGKSTQVRQLAQYLESSGKKVLVIEEPGSEDNDKSTAVANYLRKIIKDGSLARDPEINLALFSAARRELWFNKISPAISRGYYVLAARNYFSTLVYQGKGEGLDENYILQTTELFTDEKYLTPNSTIVLVLDDEKERAARISERGELDSPDTFESKDANFQSVINQAYRDLASKYSLPTIDCVWQGRSKSVDDIQQEIRSLLKV